MNTLSIKTPIGVKRAFWFVQQSIISFRYAPLLANRHRRRHELGREDCHRRRHPYRSSATTVLIDSAYPLLRIRI